MALYLLLAVPLSYGFVMSVILPPHAYGRQLWFWFFRGILSFIPSYIVYLIFSTALPLVFTPVGIVAYHFFYDDFLFSLLAGAAYFLCTRYIVTAGGKSVPEAFSFLSGFFTFVAISEFVRHFAALDLYFLLLLPTLHVAGILVLSLLFLRIVEASDLELALMIAAGTVYLVLLAGVPYAYTIHLSWIAILGTLAIAVASAVFFHAVRETI